MDFTDLTDESGVAIGSDRDETGGIIATVFEIFEALIEEWLRIIFANSGDDSAHKKVWLVSLSLHYVHVKRNARIMEGPFRGSNNF